MRIGLIPTMAHRWAVPDRTPACARQGLRGRPPAAGFYVRGVSPQRPGEEKGQLVTKPVARDGKLRFAVKFAVSRPTGEGNGFDRLGNRRIGESLWGRLRGIEWNHRIGPSASRVDWQNRAQSSLLKWNVIGSSMGREIAMHEHARQAEDERTERTERWDEAMALDRDRNRIASHARRGRNLLASATPDSDR